VHSQNKAYIDGFWKEQEEQNLVTPVEEGLSSIGTKVRQA
jgi:hypothetical protein